MLYVPGVLYVVVQLAAPVDLLIGTYSHPAMVIPLLVKSIVANEGAGETVAVKVTGIPAY